MSDKEVVDANAVLKAGGEIGIRSTEGSPTFVQWAGLILAAGVGSIIAVITVLSVIFLYIHYPKAPSLEGITSANSAVILEQYKELSGIAVKSTQDLFQTIVTQALLPVLTAILGYIFGKSDKVEKT